MAPMMTMVPETIPTGMLDATVDTVVVAAALMVLAGLVGLCLRASVREDGGEAPVRRDSRTGCRARGRHRAAPMRLPPDAIRNERSMARVAALV